MKNLFFVILSLFAATSYAQEIQEKKENPQLQFWNELSKHCGKAFAGKIITEPVPKDFQDQELKMHVIACSDNQIKIPFVVGENRSRTWVFTRQESGIQLKHDHRHEDGSPDKVTMYGGTSSNTGFKNLQYFPADQETADLIPYAAGNVWWVTVSDSTFTYNLRRVNNDSHITVEFDLTKEIEAPEIPWGWGEE
ncbi:hypothetical protein JKA74_00940 [Marivirga sp. S37H4]|uniref:Secreted protein n=1 Tax=Marivirga aurantiaca TaxID=2802615 RepID=A0A934WV98_9BACT|nr:hypothetical protein [Marivirga aurantiaca]